MHRMREYGIQEGVFCQSLLGTNPPFLNRHARY